MEKINFKDLNVKTLMGFINKLDIKVPISIEFNNEKIYCKAHPTQKTFVKYLGLPISEVISEVDFGDVQNVRFNITSTKKLKEVLNVYIKAGVEKVFGSFILKKDDESNTICVAQIEFKSKSIKTKVNADEPYLVPYLPESIWKNKLFDISEYDFKFDMGSKLIDSISNLIKFDDDPNSQATIIKKFYVKLDKNNDLISFSSKDDKWKIDYNPDGESEFGEFDIKTKQSNEFIVQEGILSLLDADKYTCFVVYNIKLDRPKHMCYFVNNNDDVVMVSLSTSISK